MKKVLLLAILTLVLVFGVKTIAGNKACKYGDKAEAKCNKADGIKACALQNSKGDKSGCYKIKKYKKLICRLKEIREIAVKENSTETVKALDELIAKKQEHLDKKKELLSKGKDCSKPCCAAKKKSVTSSKLKDSKGCPIVCIAKKNSGTSPKKTCPVSKEN